METDEFTAHTEAHRRELHVHCYRMLGSFHEAEDAVQEAFLRAWRSLDSYREDNLRAWLYRIATNTCLDTLRRSKRQVPTTDAPSEVPWLEPYPDRLLDEVAPADTDPEAVAVARETIELGFLVAMQLLPGTQRAVLILRDVLGWSAAQTAATLDLTVAAANSALQRARATLRTSDFDRRTVTLSADEQRLLQRYVDSHTRSDPAAMAALAAEDIRVTMPPMPLRYDGLTSLAPLWQRAFGTRVDGTPVPGAAPMGDWLLRTVAVNRMPAAVSYLREPGDSVYRLMKLDVLRIRGDRIAEITTFNPNEMPGLDLPATL